MTIQEWQDIHIFISSTFRDMHKERDCLVRNVFPELKERCLKEYVYLTEIDLRWGISEEELQEGKLFEIVFDHIDFCRPFFLGIIGDRYGWTQSEDAESITAQEHYYAIQNRYLPKTLPNLLSILNDPTNNRILSRKEKQILKKYYSWDENTHKFRLNDASEEQKLKEIFQKI
ncbi:MAG: DUF4062 domain-containing protein, partial [Candidatus Hodarchaeota archaeon]